jgi:predicted cupin superfamily sugar epimerase
MTPRAAELTRLLGLIPHPEGGSYKEFWRSPSARGGRAASTSIYFLLDRGEFSRWHRVDADEIWTHLEGSALELWTWDEAGATERVIVGPADGTGALPVSVVPAGRWQAARPIGGPVLCGCTVAPGFRFEGFSMLSGDPDAAARLRDRHADLSGLL